MKAKNMCNTCKYYSDCVIDRHRDCKMYVEKKTEKMKKYQPFPERTPEDMILSADINTLNNAVATLFHLLKSDKNLIYCPSCGAQLRQLKCEYCGLDYEY